MNSPRARVREAIQHVQAGREPGDVRPVLPLIEEESGLLAACHVHHEAEALLDDLHVGGPAAGQPSGFPRKTLQAPDGGVVAGENRARSEEFAEEANQQWTARFNPRPVTDADVLRLYQAAW